MSFFGGRTCKYGTSSKLAKSGKSYLCNKKPNAHSRRGRPRVRAIKATRSCKYGNRIQGHCPDKNGKVPKKYLTNNAGQLLLANAPAYGSKEYGNNYEANGIYGDYINGSSSKPKSSSWSWSSMDDRAYK